MAEGAYSANSIARGRRTGRSSRFCEGRGESFLPADPVTIRAFIEQEVQASEKPASDVSNYTAVVSLTEALRTPVRKSRATSQCHQRGCTIVMQMTCV